MTHSPYLIHSSYNNTRFKKTTTHKQSQASQRQDLTNHNSQTQYGTRAHHQRAYFHQKHRKITVLKTNKGQEHTPKLTLFLTLDV
jgi:hypothetical protein